MAVEIYIARHATPDWYRTDIPYDIAPGPPLTPQGEREAIALGEFLHSRSVQKIYASPLERAHQTGLLAAQIMDLEVTVSESIAEWRNDETPALVSARVSPFWQALCEESELCGPVCVVTHGGPLGLLLHQMGLPKDQSKSYMARFDNVIAPPAGAWLASRQSANVSWELKLMYTPGGPSEL